MITCYREGEGDDGNLILDRTYDSGNMEEDIKWSCAWMLGRDKTKVFFIIDEEAYFPKYANVMKTQRHMMEKFIKKNILNLEDEDFLL